MQLKVLGVSTPKLIVTESNFVRDARAGPGADISNCGMPPRSPDTGNNTAVAVKTISFL